MADKILYFNPYAGILEHLKIERDFLRLSRNSGFEVKLMRCDGTYKNLCSVMSANKLNFQASINQKELICIRCKELKGYSDQKSDSDCFDIEDYLDESIVSKVDSLMSVINIDNWMNFEFDGELFGRIASYEFLLNNKLNSQVIPEALWKTLEIDIRNCLLTYFASLKLLSRNEMDYVGVYNFLYGMNRAVVLAAKKLAIPTFSIQANGFLYNVHERYMIYETNNRYWNLNRSDNWQMAKSAFIGPVAVFRALIHLAVLFKAKSVMTYSTAKIGNASLDIKSSWGVPIDKKITLLTTSSADEQFSFSFVGLIEPSRENGLEIFENSLDWIIFTIDMFRDLPDRYLVIRMHPREFANKREGVNSETGRSTLEFLRSLDLPKNVIINAPSDGVSLYDLPQITDLIINSTSTVGLEFAALGIPSVIVSPISLMAYPPELSSAAFSRDSYKELVLNPPLHDERKLILDSLRWINFKFALCSVKIPKSLSLLDRIYFGPMMRLRKSFPKVHKVIFSLFGFIEYLVEKFDRRRIADFNTINNRTFKSKNILEKYSELFSTFLAKRYLSRLKK